MISCYKWPYNASPGMLVAWLQDGAHISIIKPPPKLPYDLEQDCTNVSTVIHLTKTEHYQGVIFIFGILLRDLGTIICHVSKKGRSKKYK